MAPRMTARFRAYLKARKLDPHDSMSALAGINELRSLVQWANATPEYEHDYMTPLELLARFRKKG